MTTRTAIGEVPNTADQFESAINNALVGVGERFGLYSLLASIGPATREWVASQSGIPAAAIGHWLSDQAEAGYLVYDGSTGRYSPWCDIEGSQNGRTVARIER